MTNSSSNTREKKYCWIHGKGHNEFSCKLCKKESVIFEETPPPQKKQKCSTTPGGEGGNQAYVLKSIGDTVNAHVVRKPPQNTGGSKPGGAGGGAVRIKPIWKIEFVDPPQKKDKRTYEETLETVRKLSKLMQKEGWETDLYGLLYSYKELDQITFHATIARFIKSLLKEERERIEKEMLEVIERV